MCKWVVLRARLLGVGAHLGALGWTALRPELDRRSVGAGWDELLNHDRDLPSLLADKQVFLSLGISRWFWFWLTLELIGRLGLRSMVRTCDLTYQT